jgi:RNA polymerase sigma-70 factor, ECF subfamily
MEEWNFRRLMSKENKMELKHEGGTVAQSDREHPWALRGDREELGRHFESHMPQLYRVALRILGKPQDAEEALQDGFLNAMRHLGDFECRSRFSTWLTRIVINAALMRLRKNRREVLTSFDQDSDPEGFLMAVAVSDPRPNPEEMCVWKERFQKFERELRDLPAGYRSILWMRDVQGLSTKEAAENLGVSTGVVKSQLRRARLKLGTKSCVAKPGHRLPRTVRSEARVPQLRQHAELMAELVGAAA